MKRIERSPQAQADIDEIWLHIALDDPDAAFHMVERITRATDRLADFPLSAPAHPELGDGIRSLPAGSYRVLYRVDDDRVLVIRVIHAARDIQSFGSDQPVRE